MGIKLPGIDDDEVIPSRPLIFNEAWGTNPPPLIWRLMGKVWFLAPFRRRKIKGIEMFANLENKEEPRKACSNCGAFIMGERLVLEVKIGGQPVEKKTDLCQPCYNKLKEL